MSAPPRSHRSVLSAFAFALALLAGAAWLGWPAQPGVTTASGPTAPKLLSARAASTRDEAAGAPSLPTAGPPGPAPSMATAPALQNPADPSITAGQVVPRPVHLQRAARDRQAGARLAAEAAAADAEAEAAATAARSGAHVEHGTAARVEQDIGLPPSPGARPAADAASRISDGQGGVTVTQVLDSAEAAGSVAAFYRAQLRQSGMAVSESSPGPGLVLLQKPDGAGAARLSVLIAASGSGSRITLVRTQATRSR